MKLITGFLVTLLLSAANAAEKPLKVFIFAGQSNIEGHAKVETFDFIGDDPVTVLLLLKMMRDSDGKPVVCDGASISYLTGAEERNFDLSGKLSAGYGSVWGQAPGELGDKIGPEFTFGLTIDAALDEPVDMMAFRRAMAAPAAMPEFKGNYLKKYEADLISPAETALWKRGASNAGYHYLGCAKTFALMGRAFAEANLQMLVK